MTGKLSIAFVFLSCMSCSEPAPSLPEGIVSSPMSKSDMALRKRIAGVNCITVYAHSKEPEPLARILDRFEIERFLNLIHVIDTDEEDYCECSGNTLVEFKKDNKVLTKLTVHHGSHLRWDGWNGDRYLPQKSSILLSAWLTQIGIEDVEGE
jgi:hypothetical protein